MSKSSSDEEILEKIHEILDNTSSTSSDEKQDQYLSSLKKRINSNQSLHYSSRSQEITTDTNLKPRVVIRRKEDIETPEKKKKVVRIGEKESQTKIIPSSGIQVSDESLFEVEHPSIETEDIPEFIEVKPEENEREFISKQEEPLTIKVSSEKEEDESLPKWHAVDEDTEQKRMEKPSTKKVKKPSFLTRKQDKKVEHVERKKEGQKEKLSNQKEKKTSDIWEPLSSEEKEGKTSKTKKDKHEKLANTFSEIDDTNTPLSPQKHNEEQNTEETKSSSSKNQNQGFRYNGYHLYKKEINISDEDTRTIHFFAKEPPEKGELTALPSGYEVKINRRTGVPYIRKIQK